MKRKFITNLLFVFAISVIQAQIVFDPATVDPSTLPEGISVVEIDGEQYLKAALNGWNTVFSVPAKELDPASSKFKATMMFKEGTSGFTTAQVRTFIKLISPTGNVGQTTGNSAIDFSEFVGNISVPGDTVNQIQLAGQETVTWGAVVGDTLFLGKVIAFDPAVIFNPELYDAGMFQGSDNMEIVVIDEKKYLKVALQGWNSTFVADSMVLDASWDKFVAEAKYEVGSSGYTIDQVKTFIKLYSGAGNAGQLSANSTADFTDFTGNISALGGSVAGIQVAGQETVTWGAVTGDYIYLGVVRAFNSVVMVESIDVSATGDAVIDMMGGTLQLTATVLPENATDKTVTWSVSDETMASVSETGLVTAIADGTIQVTATANDGSDVSGSIEVIISNQIAIDPMVIFDPSWFELGMFQESDKMEIVSIDEEKYLKVTLEGWNSSISVDSIVLDPTWGQFVAEAKFEEGTSGYTADQVKTFIKLYSDGGNVGQLSSNCTTDFSEFTGSISALGGLVTFIQVAGQQTVTWSGVEGDYFYLGIVKAVRTIFNVESIEISAEGGTNSIDEMGGTLQLTATVAPDNATDKSVDWSVSDETIATASTSGLVTALANGSVTVTATAKDGSGVAGTLVVNITNQDISVNNQISLQGLSIFPNPATNLLHIRSEQSVARLSIISIVGNIVKVVENLASNATITLDDIARGVYIIKIEGMDGNVVSMRLVKQ